MRHFIAFLPTYLEGGNGVDNKARQPRDLTSSGRLWPYGTMLVECFKGDEFGNHNFNNQYTPDSQAV